MGLRIIVLAALTSCTTHTMNHTVRLVNTMKGKNNAWVTCCYRDKQSNLTESEDLYLLAPGEGATINLGPKNTENKPRITYFSCASWRMSQRGRSTTIPTKDLTDATEIKLLAAGEYAIK